MGGIQQLPITNCQLPIDQAVTDDAYGIIPVMNAMSHNTDPSTLLRMAQSVWTTAFAGVTDAEAGMTRGQV